MNIERGNPMTYLQKNKYLRGEIYFVNFDPAQGSEQGGTRPALIIQNNTGNQHSPTLIVAPITSSMKLRLPVHLPISGVHSLRKDSTLLLEQIRVVDKSRVGKHLGTISYVGMKLVDAAIAVSLDIHPHVKEPTEMTLCYTCKSQFEDSGFEVRLLSNPKDPKDTCDFCNIRTGFNYEVKEV
jgi:mRNA interferase MazF